MIDSLRRSGSFVTPQSISRCLTFLRNPGPVPGDKASLANVAGKSRIAGDVLRRGLQEAAGHIVRRARSSYVSMRRNRDMVSNATILSFLAERNTPKTKRKINALSGDVQNARSDA